MNHRTYWTKYLSVFFGLLVPFTATFAQQENDENLDTYNLAELNIDEIPIEDNIMPTSRPFNSVYGTNRSILDTPRNVTIISREQLDAITIKDVRDFSKLTSSSYTKTNFGAPTTPNLRGQEADIFVNGMRRGGSVNGNGLPINFNAVESVNIVKGPAGVVYGTTNYLGGYADLITKKPFFDGPHGIAEFSIGDYNQYTWNLDYGAPISDQTAWRMSYEGKQWDGYWQFWKQKSHALYLALTHMPSDTYTIEANVEFFFADYTENWGINRVTQDLVDNGRYIPNRQTDAEYAHYVSLLGNGENAFGGGRPGIEYASHFGSAGFRSIVPVASDTIPVNRRWKLAAPGDDSRGISIFGGIDQTWEFEGDVVILNKTSFGYKDRDTFSSYHYSEYLKDNYLLENRTEVRFGGDMGDDGAYNINMGLRLRWDDIWSVNHFYNEPVNFWDMARDPNLRRVPDQGFAGNAWIPGKEPHGILRHWYTGGDPSSPTGGDTTMFNYGPFVQADLQFNERFSVLFGLTGDFLDASISHPVLGATGEFDFDGDSVMERGFKMEDKLDLLNYNLSPLFKVNDHTTMYVTYNYSETYPADTGGRPDVGGFSEPQDSELIEVGAKFSLLDDKFFMSTAYVDREFTERNQDMTTDDVFIKAFEIEFNYQPSRQMFLTMGYSYMDAVRTGGFYASSYTIDRALAETGGLYISPIFASTPAGTLVPAPGIPENLVNALFHYKWENGFGINAGLIGWGEMNSGYEGFPITVPNLLGGDDYTLIANTARLDFQYEVDFSLIYEQDDYMVKLALFNITGEENWDVNNSGYGNGSIVSRMPMHAEITFRKRF